MLSDNYLCDKKSKFSPSNKNDTLGSLTSSQKPKFYYVFFEAVLCDLFYVNLIAELAFRGLRKG